jgi:hypothetical protein
MNATPTVGFQCRHKFHEQKAAQPVEPYQIEVNSTPINQWVELTGPGFGIRLLREGSHDFHSFAELAKTLVRPGMTDLEKALAVYRFSARNFYHGSAGFGGTEMTRFINCYGYSYCWGQGDFQHLLYEAVGLRARAPQLKGHSSTEVLIDGKWRMMDAYMRLLAPSPELDGLATGEELNRQPEIWDHIREGAVVGLAKDYWSNHGDGNTYEPWQDSNAMLLTLRRRESLRIFDRGLGAWCLSPVEPADYVNGQWTWQPVLDAEHLAKEVESAANVVPAGGGFRAKEAASIEYRVETPYPLCTGTVALWFRGEGKVRVSVSTDQRRSWLVLHEGTASNLEWKLDDRLSVRQLPPSYDHDPMLRNQKREVLLRVEWTGEAILTRVEFSFLVQIHAPSVPRLKAGMNHWRLIGMDQGGSVRHEWEELAEGEKAAPTIHPKPVPKFCDGLIWTGKADGDRLMLRAALVHLVDDPDGRLLYLPDTLLSGTLTPYRGHPDEGGVRLAEPKKLENILASEFAVAEWKLPTNGLPDSFTVWVEAHFGEPVPKEKQRLLAKRDVRL